MTLLDIQNLNMGFHTLDGYKQVLHDVNLRVYPKEKVALVGESGSGKSLTVRAVIGIANYLNVEISGNILFDNMDTLSLTDKQWKGVRGKDITMIFQDPTNSLNPTYTIGKQVTDVMIASGAYTNGQQCIHAITQEMLKISITEPDRILASYPFQLSGGLNQRISIIMALLNRPKLLLADEPGTALDVTVQQQTLDLMNTLIEEKSTSCLFISHSLGVVRNFADFVYVIHEGRIVESGSTTALFESPKHPYTKALLQAIPTLKKIDFNTISYDEQKIYNTPAYHHPCMLEREKKYAK